MAITHSYRTTWTRNSTGEAISVTNDVTNEGEKNIDRTIATGTTNLQIDLAFVRSRLKSILILSNVDVTLKTNSSGSPDDTIALTANNPLIYRSDGYLAVPFSADVTTIYVTNSSGQNSNLQIRVLEDATP